MKPVRVFLGWDRGLLQAATRWILSELGSELADVDIVVPGRRAGRQLLSLLVVEAPASGPLVPPRLLTPGELPETLYRPQGRLASRGDRLLAWSAVLENENLAAGGHGGDFALRLAAATELCRVQDELGKSGVQLREALGIVELELPERDVERWRELVRLGDLYEATLTARGRIDRHLARARALEGGEVGGEGRTLVICGVADPSQALVRLVSAARDRVYSLVAAPASEGHLFDAFGGVLPGAWLSRLGSALDLEVVVGDRESSLASAAAVRWRQLHEAGHSPVVGVSEPALGPPLERALRRQGAEVHSALGRSATATGPWQLLLGIAGFIESRDLRDLAHLLRYPELERELRRRVEEPSSAGAPPDLARALDARDWLTVVDLYTEETCLRRAPANWPGSPPAAALLERLVRAVDELAGLGPDAGSRAPEAELPVQCARLRSLLCSVYGEARRDDEGDDGVRWGALEHLAELLRDLEVHGDGTQRMSFVDLVHLLSELGGAANLVLDRGDGSVDLVGWLELPLDPSTDVLVVGVNEGRLPEPPPSDAYLTPPVRRALQLPTEEHRLARDLFHLTAMSRGRQVTLFTARSRDDGEPLAPSRLALTGDAVDRAERLLRFYGDGEAERAPAGDDERCWSPPRPTGSPDVDSLRVTAFRDYLSCPYRFWLVHVERLARSRDLPDELSPGAFGRLLHSVLGELGGDPVAASGDPQAIFARARSILSRQAAALFGAAPRVVLRVQLEQALRRLWSFSRWQARQAGKGWRIEASWIERDVEAALDVDGTPLVLRGRVDRLDRHPELGWRLLDYKTAERARTPEQSHQERGGGAWRDLQLPLYHYILRGQGIEGGLELAFLNLDPTSLRDPLAVAGWSAAELAAALEEARGVVRKIRAGTFWPPGPPARFDDGLAGVAGDRLYQRDGLVGATDR